MYACVLPLCIIKEKAQGKYNCTNYVCVGLYVVIGCYAYRATVIVLMIYVIIICLSLANSAHISTVIK